MISKAFIQSLLSRVDIVDVVTKYVSMKKAGGNYHGLCPFHEEKTPSFTVSQTKQFYHCFGCREHGSAIDFMVKHAGMGFVEAVTALASEVAMTVVHEEDGATLKQDHSHMMSLMVSAAGFYQKELKTSKTAVNYLKSRGMTGDMAKLFGVGYAPDSWQALRSLVKDYNDKALVEVGLVSTGNDSKSSRDWFRNRIMFPIMDTKGNVIGFGGRVLDSSEPKYLNSPETPLFEKGKEMYGLFQAQKSIREKSAAIVVEGYMDVIALAQAGVENVVATLGTATTSYHIQRLLRIADNIIFCFDGDNAGRKAVLKALEVALPNVMDGKRISFMFLPEGQDPDDFIKKEGRAVFENMVANAETLISLLLRNLVEKSELKTPEGRIAFVQNTRDSFMRLRKNAPGIAAIFKQEVAAKASVSVEEVDQVYSNPLLAKQRQSSRNAGVDILKSKKLLLCIVSKPAAAKLIPPEYLDSEFLSDEVIAISKWAIQSSDGINGGTLIQAFKDTSCEEAIRIAQADLLSLGEGFNEEAELQGILRELKRQGLGIELSEYAARVDVNGTVGLSQAERDRYRTVLTEYATLMR